mmetsp:Transcript_134039/g.250805  ORF Transcript_134039/g.250805 Transcript_134039/m.250805 type:complete len:225 (+) Transcript_134039:1934-2608(+)
MQPLAIQAHAGEAQSEHAALLQAWRCRGQHRLVLLQHGRETVHAFQQLRHVHLHVRSRLWRAPTRGLLLAPARDCAQQPEQLLGQAWAHPPSPVRWPLVDQPVPPRMRVMRDHHVQHFEMHETLEAMPHGLEMASSTKDLETPWRQSGFPSPSSICANSAPDCRRVTACCQPSAYAPFWAAKRWVRPLALRMAPSLAVWPWRVLRPQPQCLPLAYSPSLCQSQQ